ncbi:hypothetical protein [Enterococcus sp. DIV2324]|uniref:hypothetical protein n=1 Tax=Enterococcus sp. DIV2324 TaxID=2774763 RepID=UPI003F255516
MREYVQKINSDLKKTLKNRKFWQIQWLNLLYFVKYFTNGWNEFVRVIETGITYRRNLSKDLFYVSPGEYAEYSETALEYNVAVSLRFSLATDQLKRLISPMVTANPHTAITGAPGKPKKGGEENVKATTN